MAALDDGFGLALHLELDLAIVFKGQRILVWICLCREGHIRGKGRCSHARSRGAKNQKQGKTQDGPTGVQGEAPIFSIECTHSIANALLKDRAKKCAPDIAEDRGSSGGGAGRAAVRCGACGSCAGDPDEAERPPHPSTYSWFMLARNSALLRTFSRRLINSSMASTDESGLSTLRRVQFVANEAFSQLSYSPTTS